MTQDRATPNQGDRGTAGQTNLASSYYALLGLHPSASVRQIRKAYRELSKRYHPDTTDLPSAIATAKFQQLNEAYATLSSPERRLSYDRKVGYSRIPVIQPPPSLNRKASAASIRTSSAYLDPTDRPLSAGEIFALFILGLTFVACLVLAIAIGITRGETAFQPLVVQTGAEQPINLPGAEPEVNEDTHGNPEPDPLSRTEPPIAPALSPRHTESQPRESNSIEAQPIEPESRQSNSIEAQSVEPESRSQVTQSQPAELPSVESQLTESQSIESKSTDFNVVNP